MQHASSPVDAGLASLSTSQAARAERAALEAAGVPVAYLDAPDAPEWVPAPNAAWSWLVRRVLPHASRPTQVALGGSLLGGLALVGTLLGSFVHDERATARRPALHNEGYLAAMDAMVASGQPITMDPSRAAADAVAQVEAVDLASLEVGRTTTTTTTRPRVTATTRRAASAPHDASGAQLSGTVDWDAIARCETGGNWSMQGPRFSGGLGFYNGSWNAFGGREFASNAGQASREQQIIVAERIRARYGLSGWGCKAYG